MSSSEPARASSSSSPPPFHLLLTSSSLVDENHNLSSSSSLPSSSPSLSLSSLSSYSYVSVSPQHENPNGHIHISEKRIPYSHSLSRHPNPNPNVISHLSNDSNSDPHHLHHLHRYSPLQSPSSSMSSSSSSSSSFVSPFSSSVSFTSSSSFSFPTVRSLPFLFILILLLFSTIVLFSLVKLFSMTENHLSMSSLPLSSSSSPLHPFFQHDGKSFSTSSPPPHPSRWQEAKSFVVKTFKGLKNKYDENKNKNIKKNNKNDNKNQTPSSLLMDQLGSGNNSYFNLNHNDHENSLQEIAPPPSLSPSPFHPSNPLSLSDSISLSMSNSILSPFLSTAIRFFATNDQDVSALFHFISRSLTYSDVVIVGIIHDKDSMNTYDTLMKKKKNYKRNGNYVNDDNAKKNIPNDQYNDYDYDRLIIVPVLSTLGVHGILNTFVSISISINSTFLCLQSVDIEPNGGHIHSMLEQIQSRDNDHEHHGDHHYEETSVVGAVIPSSLQEFSVGTHEIDVHSEIDNDNVMSINSLPLLPLITLSIWRISHLSPLSFLPSPSLSFLTSSSQLPFWDLRVDSGMEAWETMKHLANLYNGHHMNKNIHMKLLQFSSSPIPFLQPLSLSIQRYENWKKMKEMGREEMGKIKMKEKISPHKKSSSSSYQQHHHNDHDNIKEGNGNGNGVKETIGNMNKMKVIHLYAEEGRKGDKGQGRAKRMGENHNMDDEEEEKEKTWDGDEQENANSNENTKGLSLPLSVSLSTPQHSSPSPSPSLSPPSLVSRVRSATRDATDAVQRGAKQIVTLAQKALKAIKDKGKGKTKDKATVSEKDKEEREEESFVNLTEQHKHSPSPSPLSHLSLSPRISSPSPSHFPSRQSIKMPPPSSSVENIHHVEMEGKKKSIKIARRIRRRAA